MNKLINFNKSPIGRKFCFKTIWPSWKILIINSIPNGIQDIERQTWYKLTSFLCS